MKQFLTIFFLLLISVPGRNCDALTYEKLLELCEYSDEPGYGAVIKHVVPGSQAERLGLEVGDFVTNINDKLILMPDRRDMQGDRTLRGVIKGGYAHSVQIDPGLLGLFYLPIFRPEFSYLHGATGQRDDRWDKSVVMALHTLADQPEQAAELWERAKKQGYPKDDVFHDFVEAYIARGNGKGYDLESLYKKVIAKLGTIPDALYTGIEHLARSGNTPEILLDMKIHRPKTSLFNTEVLEAQTTLKGGVKTDSKISLMQRAHQMKRTKVMMMPPDDADRNPLRTSVEDMFHNLNPSRRQRSVRLVPKTGAKNIHLSMDFEGFRLGEMERSGQSLSVSLSDSDIDKYKGDKEKTTKLCSLSISRSRYFEGYTSFSTWPLYKAAYKVYPVPGDPKLPKIQHTNRSQLQYLPDRTPYLEIPEPVKTSDYDATLLSFDLIRIGDEVSLYLGGVCQDRVSIPRGVEMVSFGVFGNGTAILMKRFEAWALE